MSAARRAALGYFGTLLLGILAGAAAMGLWAASDAPRSYRRSPLPADPSVELSANAGYLTEVLRDALAPTELGAAIDDIRVITLEGSMIIQCTFDVFGNELHVRVTVHGHIDDGQLRLEVTDTRVGRLPLPLDDVIERVIDARIRSVLDAADIEPTGLAIHEDGITVTGRRARRPRTIL